MQCVQRQHTIPHTNPYNTIIFTTEDDNEKSHYLFIRITNAVRLFECVSDDTLYSTILTSSILSKGETRRPEKKRLIYLLLLNNHISNEKYHTVAVVDGINMRRQNETKQDNNNEGNIDRFS